MNQILTKNPVKIWIAARKNRWEKPSVIEEIWVATAGAKWEIATATRIILRITSNSTLKSEAKVETEDEEEYTFEYNNGPTYYYTSILPTETQWVNTINQGLVYFANSGINNDAGVQIVYDSNTSQLQLISTICGFDDVVISDINILYNIQIQG